MSRPPTKRLQPSTAGAMMSRRGHCEGQSRLARPPRRARAHESARGSCAFFSMKCVPKRLKRELLGQDVKTVQEPDL